jgi:hypothetical protein
MYTFLFEIVLKQDYEDIYFFREFEVNGVTNGSPSYLERKSSGSPNGRKSSERRSRKSSVSPFRHSINKSEKAG